MSGCHRQIVGHRSAVARRQEDALRELHVLPEPGHYLIEADYKQAEARALAFFTGDPRLAAILADANRDLFDEIAQDFGARQHEHGMAIDRGQAKTLFYSVIYGVSARRLAHTLGIDEDLAQSLIHHLKSGLFPKVGEYIESLRERLIKRGRKDRYLETPWGRRRRFDRRMLSLRNSSCGGQKDPSTDPEVRRAFNFLLQGTVADIIKQVQLRLDKTFTDHLMDSRVILNLHDGLYLSVPPTSGLMSRRWCKKSWNHLIS